MSSTEIKELLKLLDKKKTEEKQYKGTPLQKSVQKFVDDFNISSGLVKYPNYVIFYLYRSNGGKASKVGFFREFHKTFVQTREGKQRYYLFNKDNKAPLTLELLEKAFKYEKEYQNYLQNKARQVKKARVKKIVQFKNT